MAKYRVSFIGVIEVSANDAEFAKQIAWDTLQKEDDIFDVESINASYVIGAPNDERSVATGAQSE